MWVQLRCGIEPRTLLALAVVLVVALGFAVNHFWTGRPEPVPAPEPRRVAAGDVAGAAETAAGAGSGGLGGRRLVVDVVGKVRDPGIHRLPNGARVADALRAAGGLRPGTKIGGLNRARRLVDGEQVVVGAAAPAGGAAAGAAPSGGPAAGGGGGSAGAAPAGPVSLNSASVEQLQELPGVGPVLAQHIVDYREANGGFTSVEQLQEVDGIGESRLADIKPKVGP
jgi:competence protein ComEA